MTANSFILFITLALALLSSTGLVTARTTLLITGDSSHNAYKFAFAQQFVPDSELVREHPDVDFLVFNRHPVAQTSVPFGLNFGDVELSGNFSRLVISRLGSNEMTLDHMAVFYDYIKSGRAIVVVEIGEKTTQTLALLNKGAVCWGEARANILSPNVAYLCNDVLPEAVQSIVDLTDLRNGAEPIVDEPEARPFWPGIFASAARAERKNRKNKNSVDVDEEVEEIISTVVDPEDDPTDDDEEERPKSKYHDLKLSKKLNCKYRKSCYETGERPEIDAYDFALPNWSFSWESERKESSLPSTEDIDQDGIPDSEDTDIDITPQKLECKYRISCYKEMKLPLSAKDEEREEKRRLLTSKRSVQQGKKKTLKDIAEKTVKRVKEAEVKAAARPLPASIIVEKKLDAIEEELGKKLKCKYRKSCYETGKVPDIDEQWSFHLPSWLSFSASTTEDTKKTYKDEVDFDELEDLEKKVYCKYRKSCYETGVKPSIEPEFIFETISDITFVPDIIASSRIQSKKERCKYRKSCYETGILPDLGAKEPEELNFEDHVKDTIVPSNIQDLKALCKYRKSCYEEVAASASIETVKNIRKRRLIERETRRRRARRARMRRRSVYDQGYYRRQTRKERQAARTAVVIEELEKAAETVQYEEPVEVEVKKRSKKYSVEATETPEVVEQPEPEEPKKKAKKIEQEPEEPKAKKAKKVKEPEPEPEPRPELEEEVKTKPWLKKKAKEPEEVDEPVEPEPEEPKVKKNKRVKEPEPEPEPQPEPEEEVKPKPWLKKKAKEPEEEKVEEPVKVEELETPKKKAKKKVKEPEPEPIVEEPKMKVKPSKPKKPEPKEEKKTIPKPDQAQKDFCKYRKSCYESGEKPKIKQTMSSLFGEFEHHMEDIYKDEIEEHSETDRKLACKYRKSCYASGKVPGLSVPPPVPGEAPEEIQKQQKVKPEKKQKAKKVEQPPKEEEKDEDEEEKAQHAPPAKHDIEHDLNVDQKLQCKYRRSCYSSQKPRAKNEDHSSGSMSRIIPPAHREKCNKYYLSCREALGLPPKEKAPIGPSGRRLCRKRKE